MKGLCSLDRIIIKENIWAEQEIKKEQETKNKKNRENVSENLSK